MTNQNSGITPSQRCGSIGESLVEAKLKSFAQVLRPTSLQEFALDFYCRLLRGNIPSNIAFYVEVKTTSNMDNSWTKSIPKETIQFWLGQHFPVFIIVCDESTEKCYWISIEDNRASWMQRISDENESICLKIDKTHELKKGHEQNIQFIKKIHHDLILLNANNGIAEFISKGYLGGFPVLKLSETAMLNIRGRIRNSFNYLFNDRLLVNDFQGAYGYCKQLANFDHGHYDHFLTLARICLQLGKLDEAEENYNTSIEVCRQDHTWNDRIKPGEPKIEEVIASIEKEKNRALTSVVQKEKS
jgi:tetratricopeptide (TPR) repeat protein